MGTRSYYFLPSLSPNMFRRVFSFRLTRKHANYMRARTHTRTLLPLHLEPCERRQPQTLLPTAFYVHCSPAAQAVSPVLDNVAQAADSTLRHGSHIPCKHTHVLAHSPDAVTEISHNGCWHIYVHLHSVWTKPWDKNNNTGRLCKRRDGHWWGSFQMLWSACTFLSVCLWFVLHVCV